MIARSPGALALILAALISLPLARTGRAQGGLEQFSSVSSPPCDTTTRTTPSVPADTTFKAGSPLRTSLVEPGVTGTPLTVTGTVTGIKCGRIEGAEVDFWQADSQGRYDMTGFRLRGHQLTNATGGYRLTTIVPGAAAGRAKRLHVHVRVPGRTEFWTELYFPNDAQNAREPRYKPELLLKTTRAGTSTGQTAIFDIVLDL